MASPPAPAVSGRPAEPGTAQSLLYGTPGASGSQMSPRFAAQTGLSPAKAAEAVTEYTQTLKELLSGSSLAQAPQQGNPFQSAAISSKTNIFMSPRPKEPVAPGFHTASSSSRAMAEPEYPGEARRFDQSIFTNVNPFSRMNEDVSPFKADLQSPPRPPHAKKALGSPKNKPVRSSVGLPAPRQSRSPDFARSGFSQVGSKKNTLT